MRLKLPLLSCTIALGLSGFPAQAASHLRPKITGISHIAVYTSDIAATDHYYTAIIGAIKQPDPENPAGTRYTLSDTQFVEVLPLPPNSSINRLDHTAWNTDSAEELRLYLKDKGWKTPAITTRNSDGSKSFRVEDPEHNLVEFVEPSYKTKAPAAPSVLGHHIIHVGFLVHSREAEDTFYRDLLGFRPYWFGAMQEGKVDWVSQQAPDSHDWLEYMLTSGTIGIAGGSGIPAGMSQNSLGVLDHLSIGVASVPDSFKRLVAESRIPARADKSPKIGRDGKYQFNLYDPDGIRLELMEFHATGKPCCSPFTADDPIY